MAAAAAEMVVEASVAAELVVLVAAVAVAAASAEMVVEVSAVVELVVSVAAAVVAGAVMVVLDSVVVVAEAEAVLHIRTGSAHLPPFDCRDNIHTQ